MKPTAIRVPQGVYVSRFKNCFVFHPHTLRKGRNGGERSPST